MMTSEKESNKVLRKPKKNRNEDKSKKKSTLRSGKNQIALFCDSCPRIVLVSYYLMGFCLNFYHGLHSKKCEGKKVQLRTAFYFLKEY